MHLRQALSAALLLACSLPALAQDPRGKPIAAPADYLPSTAIYCDDGTNHAVLCSFAPGGDGSGGDPSSTGTTATGTVPATVSMMGYSDGSHPRGVVGDALGHPLFSIYALPAITGTVGLSGALPGFASTPTFNLGTAPALTIGSSALPSGAATASGQATNTAAITATQATPGTLASSAQTVTTVLPQLSPTQGSAISFGTTAATLFAANAGRHFIVVQVQGSSGGCYINGTATATADANSLYIPAGGYYESATHVGTGAVSIVCTAATTPVYSRQG